MMATSKRAFLFLTWLTLVAGNSSDQQKYLKNELYKSKNFQVVEN